MSETKREPLSKDLIKHVRFHYQKLSDADIAKMTVERRKSTYPKAKAEIVIFDADGNDIMEGREFGGNQTSLWVKTTVVSTLGTLAPSKQS